MKIFALKCQSCKKEFILGQHVVGLSIGEKKIFPLHRICAQKMKGEDKEGVTIHETKDQRKAVRRAVALLERRGTQ